MDRASVPHYVCHNGAIVYITKRVRSAKGENA